MINVWRKCKEWSCWEILPGWKIMNFQTDFIKPSFIIISQLFGISTFYRCLSGHMSVLWEKQKKMIKILQSYSLISLTTDQSYLKKEPSKAGRLTVISLPGFWFKSKLVVKEKLNQFYCLKTRLDYNSIFHLTNVVWIKLHRVWT